MSDLSPFNIDTEQWQRDIRTFAEATREALEAIAGELTNQCSPGLGAGNEKLGTNRVPQSNQQQNKFEMSNAHTPSQSAARPTTNPENSTRCDADSNISHHSDNRLADLKSELERRLADKGKQS